MNPVTKRITTALATAAAVTALFLWCPLQVLAALLVCVSMLAQFEFYQMTKAFHPQTAFGLYAGFVWLALAWALPGWGGTLRFAACLMPVVLGLFVLTALRILFDRRYDNPLGTLGITLLGFAYVPLPLAFFLRFVQADAVLAWSMPSYRTGLYTLLALIAITKLSDMGGFAFGMAFGKHKMCPAISPKKSWEGFAGSLLGSALMACLFCWIAQRAGWSAHVAAWGYLDYPRAVVLGLLIATLGTLGDLVESRFKRACGVKDSATFMPAGLGGFLDMLDSILFIPALFFPLVYLLSV